jgi:DNA-binding NarL/FixJ family response regulator
MHSIATPVLCAPQNPDVVTILLAGTNPIYGEGLRSVIDQHSELDVVARASSFAELLRLAKIKSPSIIMLSEDLLEREVGRLKWIIQAIPRSRLIVVVSKEDRDFSLALLHAGARAIVMRDVAPRQLTRGIQTVMKDGFWITISVQRWLVEFWKTTGTPSTKGSVELPELSDKESIAVAMIMSCKSNAHIALQLGTSEQTVKNLLGRLYKQFGVKDRASLKKHCLAWAVPPSMEHEHLPVPKPKRSRRVEISPRRLS